MTLHTTDFGTVEVHTWGSGDHPLGLVHAAAAGPGSLSRLARELADAGWFCIAPALHGYGRTWVEASSSPVVAQATVLDWTVRTFGLKAMFSHSMGGLAALFARLPLSGLCLYEPILFDVLDPTEDADVLVDERAMIARMEELLSVDDPEGSVATFVERWNEVPWAKLSPNARAQLAASAPRIAEEMRSTGAAKLDTATWGAAPPTLILHGDRSPVIARRMAERAGDRLPHGSVRMVSGAGHFAPVVQPRAVADAVSAFLWSRVGAVPAVYGSDAPD